MRDLVRGAECVEVHEVLGSHPLQRYEWNPETEVACSWYEDGSYEERYAPLPTPTPEEAAKGYLAALMFWLETQRRG